MKHRIVQVQHPPYSSPLAPCDILFFLRVIFEDVEDIKRNLMVQIPSISNVDFQVL